MPFPFTLIVAPDGDPGAAAAHATRVVVASGPAALVEAAQAASDPFVLLLARGATPLADAFGGIRASLHDRLGILGGAAHAGGMRRFGWMLAPAPFAPLPFELVPVEAPLGEAGVDPLVRGPLDVLAPEMVLVRRELLAEVLPDDPLAAAVALASRARKAGLEVVCRPSFACSAAPPSPDDRGRAAALLVLARSDETLIGAHRQPPAARHLGIDRETYVLAGTSPVRVRRRIPPTTVLVYGDGAEAAARRMRERSPAIVAARAVDDPAAALRAEMRVRGDRYVLLANSVALPTAAEFDALVEAIESAAHVALAFPRSVQDGCALVAVGRFPQHVVASGDSIETALETLVRATYALRRAVRPHSAVSQPAGHHELGASLVFLAGSTPEVTKLTFDAALASTRAGDEIIAVCASGAGTTVRTLRAFAEVRIELDEADPLLTVGANRAIASARGDLVVILADDVVASRGWLDAARAAFARIPILGAALPCVAGSPGGEGLHDVDYRDLSEMQLFAERRAAAFTREVERIDEAATPAIVVSREAFAQVGGIDPGFGPTRRGIADLVLRLRAAGYDVVRCEDSYVHRLDVAQSRNPAASSHNASAAANAAGRAAAIAAGFDPARRVPFVAPGAVGERVEPDTVLVVPIADAVELERAAMVVAEANRHFDAGSPMRIDVVLDGPIPTNDVVARIRGVLAECGRAIDATVSVRIERTADLAAWTRGLGEVRVVAAASHPRPALAEFPTVQPRELEHLLRTVALR